MPTRRRNRNAFDFANIRSEVTALDIEEMILFRFGNHKFQKDRSAITNELSQLEKLMGDLAMFDNPLFSKEQFLGRMSPDAPTLEDWRVVFRPVLGLEGFATGHPVLSGRRRPIVTSEVWLISEELGWARTYSRWYRLGRRHSGLSKEF